MTAVAGCQILLHFMELPFLLPLLSVQLVDLGLEAPPVLPKSFIILPFLF